MLFKKKIIFLKYVAIILLVISILFRFNSLERRLYWHDEVINSFGVSGYTVEEAIDELSQKSEISFSQLQKYQYPNTDKHFFSPVIVLANNEPQNPPLYYLISWIWLKIFGKSVALSRSISVIISLLIFPLIYQLCDLLFNSNIVGWTAIILISVSPFHLLYSQEARPYSLWMVMILLSSSYLLKAIKSNNKLNWLYYCIGLSFSFYTFPFSLFVAIGHGIYVLVIALKNHAKNLFLSYLTASTISIIIFTPWLIFTSINAHKISDWRAEQVSLLSLIKSWIGNISRVFLDFNLDSSAPTLYIIPTTLILFALVLYSIYYLCFKTTYFTWLFIITSIGVTAIAIALPDLISGGQRSRVARYLTPCFLGIELAVAYYLSTDIFSSNLWRKLISRILLFFLIVSGFLSCLTFLQADNWWHKSWSNVFDNDSLREFATVVNQSSQSIVIAPDIDSLTEDDFFELLSLTHLIKPEVILKFDSNLMETTEKLENETIFIYQPPTIESNSQIYNNY